MRIAFDAMGGDNAPAVTVEGAIETVNAYDDIEIILVGSSEEIEKELEKKHYHRGRITIRHAPEVIRMHDKTSVALRKKNSSIRVAIELVKSGEAEAVVSAGHSGVAMATSLIVLGKAEGVDRPGIAAVMPTLKGAFVLIDAGANVDCKPVNLLQFACMGVAYYRTIFGTQSPSVGLLSIGEEDTKGNELTKEAFKLLKITRLNFIGNIEGKDLFTGVADVVVSDGFSGNIVLKVSEGLAEAILEMLKQEIAGGAAGRFGYLFMKPSLRSFKKRTDYAEYGGAPLLGINGTCIICHGRSSAKAIKNAIKVANQLSEKKINQIISSEITSLKISTKEPELVKS